MAQYFMDCEFLEGTQNKTFLGMNVGKTKPTIDLISIGIVSDDGREYYAISKDFNLKEAWNRYDWKRKTVNDGIAGAYKEYWLRENVLKPIYEELHDKECSYARYAYKVNMDIPEPKFDFTYRNLKKLINKYGKTNKQIADEIEMFTTRYVLNEHAEHPMQNSIKVDEIEFYAYYGAFDYVLFSQLFGSFSNYPNRFPMYFKDLKQDMDNVAFYFCIDWQNGDDFDPTTREYGLKAMKEHPNFPKQTNEHSAIYDSRWNKELYKFLKETII